jgi:hypothetical protein
MTDTQILDWLEEEGVHLLGLRVHGGEFDGGTQMLNFSGQGNLREALTERIEEIQRERGE